MIRRTLSVWAVLALVCVLSAILIGHLWDRYSQKTEALGFSGIYERYLANQAGFGDDAQAYRATPHAGMVHEASARKSNNGGLPAAVLRPSSGAATGR
jgi:hypothetical protein